MENSCFFVDKLYTIIHIIPSIIKKKLCNLYELVSWSHTKYFKVAMEAWLLRKEENNITEGNNLHFLDRRCLR